MSDYISDLEAYIKDWTWQYKIQPLFPFGYTNNYFKIKVDMEKLRYIVDKPTLTSPRKSRPTSSVVYTSNYTNNTDEPQEVNLRVKRVTSATAKAKVTHGFLSDIGVGLKLRMPNELTSTFDGNNLVDADEEDVIEKKMTWTFSTKMTAPPRKKTVAKFEVNEERSTCGFSTYVHIYGKVKIKVTRKDTGESVFNKQVSIRKILCEYLPNADDYTPKRDIIHVEPESIKWPFRGTMDFQYGISQNEVIE